MSDEEGKSRKKVRKSKHVEKRKRPNILITGTPGTGKSTLCQKLQGELEEVKCINIGEFAKSNGCLGDYDSEYDSHEMDEDKVIDDLEEVMAQGNVIIEHHVTDIFPERWFDVVFVLRTENAALFDRLQSRNYKEKKLQDNLQCEIFQTILDEAKESYDPNIVHEIRSDTDQDLEKNTANIKAWIAHWMSNNS